MVFSPWVIIYVNLRAVNRLLLARYTLPRSEMKVMSEDIKKITGHSMRKALAIITKNYFRDALLPT